MSNNSQKKALIDLTQSALGPKGFIYKKAGQSFYKKADNCTLYIHINFGLDVINISAFVSYDKLKEVLSDNLKHYSSFGYTLSQLTKGQIYKLSNSSDHTRLIEDVNIHLIPIFENIKDINYSIDCLKSENTGQWGTASFSLRSRLLPIFLTFNGKYEEGLKFVENFKSTNQPDQIIPDYGSFEVDFKSWLHHLNQHL